MHSVTTSPLGDSLRARLTAFGLLLALAVLIPALGMSQAITGPLVNGLLILTVEIAGIGPALALGAVTPLAGLLHGVLPLPLAVMIPFIVLANGLFTATYNALRPRHRFLALLAGAALKFTFLYVAVTHIAAAPLQILAGRSAGMPAAMVSTMGWPQFATALAGGLVALAVLKLRK